MKPEPVEKKIEIMVLTEDVVNPAPDRRCKYDWTKWPVWKKDSKWILETRDAGLYFGEEPDGRVLNFLYPQGKSGRALHQKREPFSLIVSHLVPYGKESLKTVLIEEDMGNMHVSTFLIQKMNDIGIITLDDVRKACRAYLSSEDDT
jgi:hypothetical protein